MQRAILRNTRRPTEHGNHPERVDVARRPPRTKEECEHYERYAWAAEFVRGDALDVACGTGYGSTMLARRARVSGVDRDAHSVEMARARTSGTFVVAEVPPIPFPDQAFDFVVCFETVEHIEDDVEFMRDIRRVLRPAGELLLSTPNAAVSAPGQSVANRWHMREYTFTSLGALLEAAGLTVVGCHAQGFPPLISRGHRLAWRLSGLTDALPAAIARPARILLGDATVRPLDDRVTVPGFWVVRASVTHAPAAHGPAPGGSRGSRPGPCR